MRSPIEFHCATTTSGCRRDIDANLWVHGSRWVPTFVTRLRNTTSEALFTLFTIRSEFLDYRLGLACGPSARPDTCRVEESTPRRPTSIPVGRQQSSTSTEGRKSSCSGAKRARLKIEAGVDVLAISCASIVWCLEPPVVSAMDIQSSCRHDTDAPMICHQAHD